MDCLVGVCWVYLVGVFVFCLGCWSSVAVHISVQYRCVSITWWLDRLSVFLGMVW